MAHVITTLQAYFEEFTAFLTYFLRYPAGGRHGHRIGVFTRCFQGVRNRMDGFAVCIDIHAVDVKRLTIHI
jgi:hypothetical protein